MYTTLVLSQNRSVFKESPTLTQLVNDGTLAPAQNRLPQNPMLLQPVDNIGQYGGCLSIGIIGIRAAWLYRTLGYEGLVRWDAKWNRIIPNMAQHYTINKDATEFIFYLRKGLRWSDGAPFTADDIEFWYKNVLTNKELVQGAPDWLKTNDSIVNFDKIDSFTVKFTFNEPNSLFLQNLASPEGVRPVSFPKHHMMKFHKDLNPVGITSLVQDNKLDNWVDLFCEKMGSVASFTKVTLKTYDLPTLNAWNLTRKIEQSDSVAIAKRNPFYWKIDTGYHQLPYIDSLKFVICKDIDDYNQKVINQEINFVTKHDQDLINATANNPNWKNFRMVPGISNICAISLNLTHDDPDKRSLFQNKKFRMALSHAINRQKIIDELFDGETEPYQVAPQKSSPYFHKELATQYIQYNKQLAQQYLDELGLEQDQSGNRLFSSGKPLEIILEYCDLNGVDYKWKELLDYIAKDWQKIGVKMTPLLLSRSESFNNKRANTQDANIWVGEGGVDVLIQPRFYLPASTESNYGIKWFYWFTSPQHVLAEKPPAIIREQFNIYNQIKKTSSEKETKLLVKQLLDISADQFYVIGICTPPHNIGLKSTNLKNIPSIMPNSWTYPTPAPTNLCQYYIEEN